MVKVSVIVPIYNVYEYLDKCLSCLAKQSLKDIEIILVNDGSKDDSQSIVSKYVEKYPQMKSYIKKNGGLSDARNYGIKRASGEYIAFLDSDDYGDKDMYKRMYEKAISGNFDIVVCDLFYVYGDKLVNAYSNVPNDTNNIKETMLNIYPSAWNKIYKRSLFDKYNLEFKKGVWFEDVEFIYRLIPHVKNIGVVSKPYYYYVQREGSITNTVDLRIYHYIDNLNGVVDYYKENDLFDEYRNELEYVYVRYLYATFIKQASKYEYLEYLKAVSKAIENVNNNFPGYRKNKYFYRSIKGIYLLLFNKWISKFLYKKLRKKYGYEK